MSFEGLKNGKQSIDVESYGTLGAWRTCPLGPPSSNCSIFGHFRVAQILTFEAYRVGLKHSGLYSFQSFATVYCMNFIIFLCHPVTTLNCFLLVSFHSSHQILATPSCTCLGKVSIASDNTQTQWTRSVTSV